MSKKYQDIISHALQTRKYAYAPYSHFSVGAALLSVSGNIFTGCNVENSSYSVCSCAERTALFKAVSKGVKEFQAIAVVGGEEGKLVKNFCPPCGVCRQALQEFCDPLTFDIVLFDNDETKVFKLSELLPLGFNLYN